MGTRTRHALLTLSALLFSVHATTAWAQATSAPAAKPALTQEELEQLVAPIALYPDSLMTQVLMGSTYPLEIVQADRFAKANKDLKGDALAKELEKQTWDPSVRSLVNFPTVLDMMSMKLDATTKLGDAFLSDQKRVLDAVQKLRAKAQASGNLKTNEQQKVIVEQQASVQVIKIESPSPQVIYVPTYNPVVVYGAWPYPAHPPYYYHPPGYVATAAISFGVGVAAGVAWGYAWGNADWGRGDVNIDIDRNVNINANIDRSKYKTEINQLNGANGGKGSWQHNPQHRQGVAYRDDAAAKKFGGTSANQAIQARDDFRGRTDAGRGGVGGAGTGGPAQGGAGGVGDRGGAGTGGAGVRGGASGVGSAGGAGGLGGGNKPSALDSIGQSGSAARAASDRGAASRSGSLGGGGGGASGAARGASGGARRR